MGLGCDNDHRVPALQSGFDEANKANDERRIVSIKLNCVAGDLCFSVRSTEGPGCGTDGLTELVPNIAGAQSGQSLAYKLAAPTNRFHSRQQFASGIYFNDVALCPQIESLLRDIRRGFSG